MGGGDGVVGRKNGQVALRHGEQVVFMVQVLESKTLVGNKFV